MSDLIGPTFGNELTALGLHDGIAWNAATGELYFNPDVTDEVKDQVRAALAAHDPSKQLPKVQFTFLEFMALFSPAEQAAIVGSSDVQVKLFLLMASGATVVDFTDPRIPGALDYLTASGLLAMGRKAEIMSGTAPA